MCVIFVGRKLASQLQPNDCFVFEDTYAQVDVVRVKSVSLPRPDQDGNYHFKTVGLQLDHPRHDWISGTFQMNETVILVRELDCPLADWHNQQELLRRTEAEKQPASAPQPRRTIPLRKPGGS
jgi:hypothetical protein